jgi:hypothetical protein
VFDIRFVPQQDPPIISGAQPADRQLARGRCQKLAEAEWLTGAGTLRGSGGAVDAKIKLFSAVLLILQAIGRLGADGVGSTTDSALPAGCETLIAELTRPTYDFTVNGKKIVEAKRDLKRRGLPSPDVADAFLLTFAGIPRSRQIERHRWQHEPARSW